MTSGKPEDLFFIALIIGGAPGEEITGFKQEMSDRFDSRRALNSPPHITLVPPFRMDRDKVEGVLAPAILDAIGGLPSVDLRLHGFGAFKPRVIYVRPEPNESLVHLQSSLLRKLSAEFDEITPSEHGFHPHVTIGFRDLEESAFYRAWTEFKERSFSTTVHFNSVEILHHHGGKWHTFLSVPLG